MPSSRVNPFMSNPLPAGVDAAVASAPKTEQKDDTVPLKPTDTADTAAELTRKFAGIPILKVRYSELELYITQRLPRVLSDLPRVSPSRMTDTSYVRRWVRRAERRTHCVEELSHRLLLQQSVIEGIMSLMMTEVAYGSAEDSRREYVRDVIDKYQWKYMDFYNAAMEICRQM